MVLFETVEPVRPTHAKNSGTRTQEHTRTQWFGAAKAAAFSGILMLNIKETKNSKHGSALPYIRGTNVLHHRTNAACVRRASFAHVLS